MRFLISSAVFMCAVLFYNFPEIDLWFSGLFYDPELGFFLGANIIVLLIYKAAPSLVLIFVVAIAYKALRTLWWVRSVHPKYYLPVIYVTLVCVLGPGYVIHEVVKDHFGRARPTEIIEFGGHSYFTPAFAISDQCMEGCSFVSGHSAVGYMIYAIAFLYHGRRRVYWQVVATFTGSIIGIARVMQGSHFLSDVVFSGVLVFLTAYFLSYILRPHEKI
jgi:lipid A 4'-phosphatase